ncbi:phosphatidylglycerophosphatase A [Arenimonas sp. GDDSR-1]|uniref:phosphatidylglycerophosphatase A family protein n=1 Tax=Arenimonas sp. GDDSR-1 TaxID=2950125 RepID=UPI00261B4480|nr:phosphatidylglycerophosphatase A [Arenimonas sp. GDDSR-1]
MFTDQRLFKHPYAWIALGFGSGLSKKAPGTAGSLLALLLWWGLMAEQPVWLQLLVIAVGFELGVRASNWMIAKTGVKDPGYIVWDEFIGQWIALLLLPKSLPAYALAFALFRLFDIVKRGPVGWADRRFSGGFGVMIDDVIAGLLALASAKTVFYFIAALPSF